jgi:hypothetical protein
MDPAECYRVRDLSFVKDDIKLYLNDGYLIFSKPVLGRRLSALFTTDVEGGDGEVIVIPPNRSERQSLATFTQSPNLDEHVRTILMILTDDSTVLRNTSSSSQSRPRRRQCRAYSPAVGSSVANISTPMQMRLWRIYGRRGLKTGLAFSRLAAPHSKSRYLRRVSTTAWSCGRGWSAKGIANSMCGRISRAADIVKDFSVPIL